MADVEIRDLTVEINLQGIATTSGGDGNSMIVIQTDAELLFPFDDSAKKLLPSVDEYEVGQMLVIVSKYYDFFYMLSSFDGNKLWLTTNSVNKGYD